MTTETDICNLALSRIGHDRQISDINEATKEGDLLRLHYSMTRDALLRSHPWNFAIKRAELASVDTTPSFEFDYVFALPTDCLRVLRTSWEAQNIDAEYRIEGRYLLTNEAAVKIEYIGRITDPAQFDYLFIDIFAQRLAAECAMPLINDARVAQSALQIYGQKLSEARTLDAQEGTPRQIVHDYDWLTVRV